MSSGFLEPLAASQQMGCLKGKSEDKSKPGRYRCAQCGAVSKKKDHVCQPKKIAKIAEPGARKGE